MAAKPATSAASPSGSSPRKLGFIILRAPARPSGRRWHIDIDRITPVEKGRIVGMYGRRGGNSEGRYIPRREEIVRVRHGERSDVIDDIAVLFTTARMSGGGTIMLSEVGSGYGGWGLVEMEEDEVEK
jgi:hypothetical protein